MKKWICTTCGFIYDEAVGIPDQGIPPGTRFEDLPEDWLCPDCNAEKEAFEVYVE
jgi:rubredoxin